MTRLPLRVGLGVGLVAGTTVALQVLLTRILGAELFYHFGFLAISLALLGVGGGAIAVYVWADRFDRVELRRGLARWTVAYAAALALAPIVLVRLDYRFDAIEAGFIANLAAACVTCAVPFLLAGVAIALAVRGYTRAIGTVYAFDLAGAALGAVVVVPLLWLVDAPVLAVALALVAAAAAVLFAPPRAREARLSLGALAAAALVLVLGATTPLAYLDPVGPDPAADRWTPLSRVLGYEPPRPGANGIVIYDRVVGEVIPYRPGDPYPDWRRTQEGPQSIAFQLTGPGRTAIIGGGGGRDVLAALGERQQVDVIELNRGIREVVDEDLAATSGRPYSLPGVRTRIGDGRSTLARGDDRYDVVAIGFTDTFSANSGQAYALTEANLYTVEAVDEYLDRLNPGGLLSLARPTRHSGDEALRATVLSLEALRRRGVADPQRHVVVIRGRYEVPFRVFEYGTVLVSPTPFTDAQLAQVRRLAGERGTGLLSAPGGPHVGAFAGLAAAPSLDAFCSAHPVDVCAPTDDRPFFFMAARPGDVIGGAATTDQIGVPDPLVILAVTLALLLVLCALAFVVPLLVRRERRGRPTAGSLGFFAAIGVGFLLLEVVLIQRFVLFLGFPTYALSVVLFSLLLWTGAGALLSTRAERSPRRALLVALAAGCALIALSAFGLQPLLRALIDLPFAARVAVTVALLAPAGICLGMAMPIGLRRLDALHPAGVPWAWGVNGAASVLASVLGIWIAITAGFAVTTLVALACYLAALAHAALGRWPDGSADGAGPRRDRPAAVAEPALT